MGAVSHRLHAFPVVAHIYAGIEAHSFTLILQSSDEPPQIQGSPGDQLKSLLWLNQIQLLFLLHPASLIPLSLKILSG